MSPHEVHLSSLSPTRRQLVRLMQRLHHGRIAGLHVRAGQPLFTPVPTLVRAPFCTRPRPESHREDFALKRGVLRLLEVLDALGKGTATIEVLDGLPHCFQAIPTVAGNDSGFLIQPEFIPAAPAEGGVGHASLASLSAPACAAGVCRKIDERVLLPEVQQQITERVRRTVRHQLFNKSDYDDVFQDLIWHLHKKIAKYTPARGDLLGFVYSVLRNRALNLIRQRERELPPKGLICSPNLDVVVGEEPNPDTERLEDLRNALTHGVAELPPDLQAAVEELQRGLSIKAIAEGMGVARSTLIERLRKALSKTEVGDYLKKFRQLGESRCSEM